MKKLRVLVVEDSPTVRRYLCGALEADPDIEVVAEAEDGQRAIELCGELRPDVVTLDMIMPLMSGLAATEYIMAYCPTPILVVSSSMNRGELFKTYDALAAGAVDVLDKPSGEEADGEWEARLIAAVKLVAKIKVITHPRARLRGGASRPDSRFSTSPVPFASPLLPAPLAVSQKIRVAAIGASTGGPGAIVDVLRGIAPGFPVPLLFVLHIGEPFGSAFVEWLDGQTPHRASIARDGEDLASASGRVVMAPPGWHILVRGGRIRLSDAPERHSCRPSIDVLFESLALEYGASAMACLLTGMGRDGAAGLLALRRAGGPTIAQDEATSVVYGMPREAALLDAACRVLPLPAIGPALASLARAGRASGGAG